VQPRRILFETLALILLVGLTRIFVPSLALLSSLLAIAYLLIERRVRGRSWKEIGFDLRGIPRQVGANWFLILLVGIITQLAVALLAARFLPAFIDHVLARMPFTLEQVLAFLPLLAVLTLVEEITYRALFQARLSWFIPPPLAIALVSVVFGLVHISPGDPAIVSLDVILVIVDGALYGIIFSRSRNVFVSWLAHLLSDVVAIAAILIV
jgi:membrane protease YdiL (CAAX protease family)